MAFDLQRALLEGLSSRIPFLDRLLSYCYFAEMSVLEVASHDARGRGVSLVGRVGPEGPEERVLVAPLPFQACRRGVLEDPQDQRRALHLVAATWAMASLQRSGRPGPGIALIALHPDLDGEALTELTRERDLLRPRRFVILGGSVCSSPEVVAVDGLLVHVSAPLPVRPLPRPLRDIQVWRCTAGNGLFAALEEVFSCYREDRIVPLLVQPRAGVLLEEPTDAEVTVGLTEDGIRPPGSWVHVDSPTHIGTQGSWGERFRAWSEGFLALAEAARRSWGDQVPDGAIRVVGMASRDPVGIDVLLWVPAGSLDQTWAFLKSVTIRGGSLVLAQARASLSESPMPASGPRFPPGLTLRIPEGLPVEVLGTRREEESDPVQESLLLARDLKTLLEGLEGLRGAP